MHGAERVKKSIYGANKHRLSCLSQVLESQDDKQGRTCTMFKHDAGVWIRSFSYVHGGKDKCVAAGLLEWKKECVLFAEFMSVNDKWCKKLCSVFVSVRGWRKEACTGKEQRQAPIMQIYLHISPIKRISTILKQYTWKTFPSMVICLISRSACHKIFCWWGRWASWH